MILIRCRLIVKLQRSIQPTPFKSKLPQPLSCVCDKIVTNSPRFRHSPWLKIRSQRRSTFSVQAQFVLTEMKSIATNEKSIRRSRN
jgi:hypothetical protein